MQSLQPLKKTHRWPTRGYSVTMPSVCSLLLHILSSLLVKCRGQMPCLQHPVISETSILSSQTSTAKATSGCGSHTSQLLSHQMLQERFLHHYWSHGTMLGAVSPLGLRQYDRRGISVLSGAVLQRKTGHQNSQGSPEANQTLDKQKEMGSTHIGHKHTALASSFRCFQRSRAREKNSGNW